MKKLLDVGGASSAVPLPAMYLYQGWEHLRLDIDPAVEPDIVGDARQLVDAAPATYDAIYCSHNLEHYHRHDVIKVLQGFAHVLKDEGFAHLRVPDLSGLMRLVVQKNLDVDDALYTSDIGPILVRDVLYGHGLEIERSGSDFYAHKTGFTQKSLTALLHECGFRCVLAGVGALEVRAFAFKSRIAAETVNPSQLTPAPFWFPSPEETWNPAWSVQE
jgi:hypothetical protein